MIVVGLLSAGSGKATTGLISEIARRAAAAPSAPRVEALGVVPGDAAWDRVLFQLAQVGAGHATVVRSSRGSMEAADLDLALHYLPDVRAIVLVGVPPQLLGTAIEAASWTGAPLVLIGPMDGEVPEAHPGVSMVVLEAPEHDPDGTFAGFVAAFAVRLDAGEGMDGAWRATIGSLAVDRVRV